MSVYQIRKRFTFEAAHWLSGLPEEHKCRREHGHSYTVEVVVEATELCGPGFVIDFSELDLLEEHIVEHYDHKMLNDVIDVPPTSENLAKVLFDWCCTHIPLPETAVITAVRVSETSRTWAEYRGDEPEVTR